ncbi:MAG: hypothetical protein JKZ03_01040 [Flavobacteriaceae bacterium]|nr:hypothetical protein [Flavobacteriaceae bacterium]
MAKEANKNYFASRISTGKKEFPLYLNGKMAQMVNGKIYSIMRALDVLLGKAKMNALLKSFTITQKDTLGNWIKPLGFLERIYTDVPQQHHQLLDTWFKRVITYDFAIENADYTKTTDGRFKISLEVNSKRFETRNYGEDFQLDIDEAIQIGIFSKHPKAIENDTAVLYLKPHQINATKMIFEIIVDALPKYIAIDPYGTRMDKKLENNLRAF